jgi:hypothetical protein
MSDRGGGGYEVNPGSKWAAGGSGNQIGDYEGNSYAWRQVNGALVQPYWSAKDGGWLAPDGNSQVMYLNPIWQWNGVLCGPNDCTYTGQNTLTVNGDQPGFGPNDTITIAKTAAGGVQVTLNGEVFPFDPNQITSITVKPGAGSNVINVESLPANVTLTINDAANSQDTVNLSPSAHNVTNIQGSVTIVSSSPATTLTAFDQMDPQAHNVNLNFQTIVGLTPKPIVYQNLASLSFYVGQGTNVDTINDPSKLSRIFYWQEGAGLLEIDGGSSQTNTLEITGKTTGEQFSVWATTSTLEFVLQNQNNNTVGHIYATGVQNLMLDEADSGNLYTINDLSKTTVQQVYVNMHAAGGPNGTQDRVIVNGSAVADDQVITSTGAPATFVDQQGIPIGKATGAYTNVDLTMKYPCGTYCPPPSHYQVKVAIPKPVDKLTINTFGGNDTVSVRSTQPRVQAPATGGHLYVNTGGGDDQITVGDPNDGLDNLFGPLDIDAGTGHNKVTFDETGSYVHDIVMLSASQLIRYTQTSSVTITRDGRTLTQTGYPFIINYKATQGDFLPGVNFKSSFGSTDLYLPETGTNAPPDSDGPGLFPEFP